MLKCTKNKVFDLHIIDDKKLMNIEYKIKRDYDNIYSPPTSLNTTLTLMGISDGSKWKPS